MRHAAGLTMVLVFTVPMVSFAASKDSQPPDKEMLRMMDFLREMEMIKQVEMMQDLSQVEKVGEQNSDAGLQKPLPSKRKEAAR